jgi:hypothetical protein
MQLFKTMMFKKSRTLNMLVMSQGDAQQEFVKKPTPPNKYTHNVNSSNAV